MKTFLNSFLSTVLLIFVSILFLNSCSKDNDDPTPASIPLIASMSEYHSNGLLNDSASFQYDNKGRLIKMTLDNGTYSTWEYSDSIVVSKRYFNDGKLDDIINMKLNNKGLGISVSFEDFVELEHYEFDSNGYRKSSKSEGPGWIYTITYVLSNGNYVTIISENKPKTNKSASLKEFDFFMGLSMFKPMNGEFATENSNESLVSYNSRKTDFQFYEDRMNTIEYENMGLYYYGKPNKNPIKQSTSILSYEGPDGPTTSTTIHAYSYEYDKKGRITKQAIDDGAYTVYTYVD